MFAYLPLVGCLNTTVELFIPIFGPYTFGYNEQIVRVISFLDGLQLGIMVSKEYLLEVVFEK